MDETSHIVIPFKSQLHLLVAACLCMSDDELGVQLGLVPALSIMFKRNFMLMNQVLKLLTIKPLPPHVCVCEYTQT